MRKYLLGLFAIVMAVSLSAFTSAKKSSGNESTASLHWFVYDQTSGVGTYLGYGERSTFLAPGCNQSVGIDCRRGYASTELEDPTDPEQGVEDVDANADQIRMQ